MFYLVIVVTNRHTDRQTNAGKNITPRFRGDNNTEQCHETSKSLQSQHYGSVIAYSVNDLLITKMIKRTMMRKSSKAVYTIMINIYRTWSKTATRVL